MYLRLSPYREVLQGVLTSLQVNEGIIKITGKTGSGKTALCSQLFHDLEDLGQPAVFFLKPPASAIALQNDILDNLRLDSTGNFTRTLTTYLLTKTTAQAPLVLLFDDAQQLDAQTFSAIRMLCNIQDQSRALVRVILCGNEELDARLEGPALRAVTQFLNQSFTLPYLTQEQVKDFCQGYWQMTQQDMKPLGERSLQRLFQDTRGHPGILQARLNQGTTGAEPTERHRDTAAAPAQASYKYAGSRPGWVPTILLLAGLLLLGGAGAWYLLQPANERESVAVGAAPAASDAPAPQPAVAPAPQAAAAPAPETAIAPAPVSAIAPAAVTAVAPVPVTESPPPEPVVDADPQTPSPATATPAPTLAAPPPAAEVVADDAVIASEEAATPDAASPDEEEMTPAAPSLPSVDEFLASWTGSWQRRDVDAYLAHYHPEFVPAQGLELEAWREQRRRVITNASDLVISFDTPEVISTAQDGTQVLQFWLNYSAANYADRTLKELVVQPVDGQWRIRAETSLRTERL